jgi:hypothetical protein
VTQSFGSASDADTSIFPVARIFSSSGGHWLTRACTSAGAMAANFSGL